MDESNQLHEPGGSNDEVEIDPEVWLQALLAMTGDKERRATLIQTLSERTGFASEKVELIISTLMATLVNQTRSN